MAQSRYLGHLYSIRPPLPRYRGGGGGVSGDPFSAGWGIGEKVGGGLAEAYKNAMANKYANQIMNAMPTGQDTTPTDLGNVPGDGGDSSPAPDIGSTAGEEAYVTGEPVTGEGLPTPAPATTSSSDEDLARGMAAARLTGGISPTVGSVVHTGGVQELNAMKEGLAIQREQAALALEQAKARLTGAIAGGRDRGGGGGKIATTTRISNAGPQEDTTDEVPDPKTYVPGSGDPNNPLYNAYPYLQKDLEPEYGKNGVQVVQDSLQATDQANNALEKNRGLSVGDTNKATGQVISANDLPDDPNSPDVKLYKRDNKGNLFVWKVVPREDYERLKNRINSLRINNGQSPLGSLPGGINDESGMPPGTNENPIKPKNNLEFQALPFGTVYVGLDGRPYVKKAGERPH